MDLSKTSSFILSPGTIISDEKFQAEQAKKHPLIRLLKLTGLYFGLKEDSCFWYYSSIFRASVLLGLLLYQTGCMVYHLLTIKKADDKTSNTVFLLSWKIQCVLSIIFLIYWQLGGHLQHLFTLVTWPCKNQSGNILKSIKIVSFLLAVWKFSIMATFAFLSYAIATEKYEFVLTDIEIFDIGHGLNNNMKLSDQLLEKYTKHIQMAKIVRTVNSTFEVYTFAMIGLNIPTTIFSLISLFTTDTFEQLIFIIQAPIFCCIQLICLTAIPARVHTAIQEVRNILYNNTNIWKPYDEKTYQIASVFVSHVDHANLGISVWGFAIVTKPLILTTISLTVTYLTILLQLQINKGDKNTLPNQFLFEVSRP